MTKPKTYAAGQERFCNKCSSWQSQEGGKGKGVKYRCGKCDLFRTTMKAKDWTPEQIEELKRLYPHTDNATLVVKLGRTIGSIPNAARRFGVKKSAEYLSTIAIGGGRPPVMRHAFIAECDDLLARGASLAQLIARSGKLASSVRSFLEKAIRAGELAGRGKHARMRYYRNEAEADALAALVAAELKATSLARLRERQRIFRAKLKQSRPAKAPKPPKLVKVKQPKPPKAPKLPKPIKLAEVVQPKPLPDVAKLAAFKSQEAIRPPGLKVQYIKTPPPRFHVEEVPAHGFSGLGIGRYIA